MWQMEQLQDVTGPSSMGGEVLTEYLGEWLGVLQKGKGAPEGVLHTTAVAASFVGL